MPENQFSRNFAAATKLFGSSFRAGHFSLLIVLVPLSVVGVIVAFTRQGPSTATRQRPIDLVAQNRSDQGKPDPRYLAVWWGDFPESVMANSEPVGTNSNIHPLDYCGPENCRKCHPKNYESWSEHSHRWMNALANDATVKGNFANQMIHYLGGVATFYEEPNDEFRMKLVREETRIFEINQTIGSRFFQYYIGKQIDGPELPNGRSYREDHVLPFGYWLAEQEWVPVVHIFDEVPDGERLDPFDAKSYAQEFPSYAESCSVCHTTFPLGDLLTKNVKQMAREVPTNLHWSGANYLKDQRDEWSHGNMNVNSDEDLIEFLSELKQKDAPTHAATLGISCEACHLGAAAHARAPKTLPRFFPTSPYLRTEGDTQHQDFGKSHANVNWACGRCHSGDRPQFAGGMSTWNSTEYSDAMRGSCYSELRCIDCHNPHESIGKQWSRTPSEDDAQCIKCHAQFESHEALEAHSHHPFGSEDSHCMDCHMPRINEGMQDIVRTHTIFSPTDTKMLKADHPNACNQCHTKESKSWALSYLEKWYDKSFDGSRVNVPAATSDQPAAINWLHSENEAVRLVAADSLFRTDAKWALSELIQALDDPYLMNRQFARIGIERMLDVSLEADFGYRYHMTPEERRKPIEDLLATYCPETQATKSNVENDGTLDPSVEAD